MTIRLRFVITRSITISLIVSVALLMLLVRLQVPGAPSVLYLGDSMIVVLSNAGPLPAPVDYKVTNAGYGGEDSADILYHWRSQYMHHWDYVVLWVGRNDLACDMSDQGYEDHINELVWSFYIQHVRHVAIVNILPSAPANGEIDLAEHIVRLNARLKALASRRKLVFVDAYSLVSDGHGAIDPRYDFGDGIHLNAAGNRLISGAIYAALFGPF